MAGQPSHFTAGSSPTPAVTNISTFLPCLCYFGKKARNHPVLCYKNVKPLGRAAVIVPLAGYLIRQEGRRAKGRAGTAPVRHMEEVLSHRVSICTNPVHLRGTGRVYDALPLNADAEPLNLTTPSSTWSPVLDSGQVCAECILVTAARMLMSGGATATQSLLRPVKPLMRFTVGPCAANMV